MYALKTTKFTVFTLVIVEVFVSDQSQSSQFFERDLSPKFSLNQNSDLRQGLNLIPMSTIVAGWISFQSCNISFKLIG